MTALIPSTSPDPVVEPSSPSRAAASGPAPYRTLLVGGGAFAGDDALTAALAEALAIRTGHGVDVEGVIAEPLAEAADGLLLLDHDLAKFDAAVVVIDPERLHLPVPETVDAVRALVEEIGGRLVPGSAQVLVVPSPLTTGLPPRMLDAIVDGALAHTDALTPVVRLDDDRTTAEQQAARWARRIADAVAPVLIEPMVSFRPDDHVDEDLRLDAVDRLPPRDGLWVARFQRIVDEARALYGTSSAALSIVDADHARYGVTVGFEQKAIRRGQTICNRVLRTYGGLIVGDAQADLRFQRNPDVRTGDVRFYAGHRIESRDGAPLGSLCVFDPNPRDVRDRDMVRLRDLAIGAQRSLWAFQDGADAPS